MTAAQPQAAPAASLQPLTFRRMTVEDVPAVHAIDTASFSLPWTERSFLFEVRENPNARPWVVEITEAGQKKIIAMLVLWLILDEAHVATIAVHPAYRRQGVARRLLAHALLAALPQAQVAFLEVRRSNLAAQAMYRRFGFEVAGERRRYYQDNGEDALLMTLNGLDAGRLQILLDEGG